MNFKYLFLGFALFFAILLAKAIHDNNLPFLAEQESSLPDSPDIFSKFPVSGTLVDERDGQEYPILEIGGLSWLGKNLNYKAEGSVCFQHENENCDLYGRLYSYPSSRNACPEGWRLPSHQDWKQLKKAGKGSKADPFVDGSKWEDNDFAEGDNALGMDILPAGRLDHLVHEGNKEHFSEEGISASYWLDDSYYHWHVRWGKSHTHKHGDISAQKRGFSIRCVCETPPQ